MKLTDQTNHIQTQQLASETHLTLDYFDELARLVDEARERFKDGQRFQALSSLTAIPSLHQHICTNFETDEVHPVERPPAGHYL